MKFQVINFVCFSGVWKVLPKDAEYMELFIRFLLPRNRCIGNLRSRHEQSIFLTSNVDLFPTCISNFTNLILQNWLKFHNSMQVVLTCTHTCLHKGRKPSPNRRRSSTKSVVSIDFLPNTGYVYITCHVMYLDQHVCVSRGKNAYLINVSLKYNMPYIYIYI
jgi:hypothetical protein